MTKMASIYSKRGWLILGLLFIPAGLYFVWALVTNAIMVESGG